MTHAEIARVRALRAAIDAHWERRRRQVLAEVRAGLKASIAAYEAGEDR